LKIFCPLFKGVGGSKVCEATLKKTCVYTVAPTRGGKGFTQ
jgi:hypothetical protein